MDYELNEGFTINDDNTADWALRVIKENEEERDRLIAIAEGQIADLEQKIFNLKYKYEEKSKFLRGCLAQYMDKVPHKSTKTQETYQLLSGKLVFKKASQKMVPNEEKLLSYLDANNYKDLIKVKHSVDWANFKTKLKISDNSIIVADTGEIIPTDVIAIEDVPASFDIKLN